MRHWCGLLGASVMVVIAGLVPANPVGAGVTGSVTAPTTVAPGESFTVEVNLTVTAGILPGSFEVERRPRGATTGSVAFTAVAIPPGPVSCEISSSFLNCTWTDAAVGDTVALAITATASSDASGTWSVGGAWHDQQGLFQSGFDDARFLVAPASTTTTTSTTTTEPTTTTTSTTTTEPTTTTTSTTTTEPTTKPTTTTTIESTTTTTSTEPTTTMSPTVTTEPPSTSTTTPQPSGPNLELGLAVVARGQQQSAAGSGFQPGEVVSGVQRSVPLDLGTAIADADGNVTYTWTIRADETIGEHTVTMTGTESGSVSATFTVTAAALPATGGSDRGLIIAAVAAVTLGSALVVLTLRRRDAIIP